MESAGRTYSRGKIIRQSVLIAINAQASGDFIYWKTVFSNYIFENLTLLNRYSKS